MPKTPRKRRLKAKTDYKARLALLKSEKPRLVVRKTNRYIIAQIVESDIAQDKTIIKFSSKDLLTMGWPKEKAGSLKSLQASYLTGFFLGKSAKQKISKELILDIGMHRSIPSSRIYAVLKGALDADLKISHNKEILPTNEQLNANPELKRIVEAIKEGNKG